MGLPTESLSYARGFLRLPDGTLQYPIIDPSDPDGRATFVTGINDSGVISGYYSTFQEHGFLLSNGVFTDISEIQGGSTAIYSINNNSDFCGAFGPQIPLQHGFISMGGNLTQVDVPGYSQTDVAALGADGSSVGVAFSQGQQLVAYVRGPKGTLHLFEAKGAGVLGTRPTGINTQAQLIVGSYYDTSFVVHGFVLHYKRSLDEAGPLATAGAPAQGPENIDVTVVNNQTTGDTFITGVNANGAITGYWQDPVHGSGAFGWIGTPIQ